MGRDARPGPGCRGHGARHPRRLPERIPALLDIGTGTGRLLELLAPRTGHALGLDASREMLALARARLSERGLADRASVRQADMYRLPLADCSQDVVTLQMVLHYAEDPAAALAEAARVLKPGGTLLVADLAAHDRAELLSRYAHRWPGFDDAALAGWLGEAQCAIAATRDVPARCRPPLGSRAPACPSVQRRLDREYLMSRPHLLEALASRVLLCDGGMGSRVQALTLDVEKDYWDKENCTEVLSLSRPDIVRDIHRGYFEAGADMVLTNTFGGSPITLEEFQLGDRAFEINKRGVELAREAAEASPTAATAGWWATSGPGTKLPSLGHITYDALEAALTLNARG
jgi:SAM-dependent methyltransferase